MLGALLATLLFAMSAVSSGRISRMIGGTEANFWRLTVATLFLSLAAFSFGQGLAGAGFPIFFLSGCIGFGLGDVALFQALPRLGTRQTSLVLNCLAAPFGALLEWVWLGTRLTGAQVGCSTIILAGVAFSLAPGKEERQTGHHFFVGLAWGILAALGQAGGAVLSRKAYAVGALAGQNLDGLTAAFQRIIGGLAVTGICLLVVKRQYLFNGGLLAEGNAGKTVSPEEKWRRAGPWVVFNALAGPTIGVSCYLWALKTTAAGLVLLIISLTPLVVIPFTRWLEGEKPTARSIWGGVIAVTGAAALALVSR